MCEQKTKRIVFIINPKSGALHKDLSPEYLAKFVDKTRYTAEIIHTEYAGHATQLAAKAVQDNVFMVVAVGGDGTINEIARSLIHTDTVLGIIPGGSGNGLARHLQIPMETEQALQLINTGIIQAVDYGTINDKCFFCTCGTGFDAFVSLKFAEAGTRGMLTYLEETLRESLTYQPETYELETEEGKIKHKAFLIACGNASQYGNNAYITPQAMVDDGLMDITILEPFTVLDVPSLAFQLFNKTIDHNSRIKTFRCRKLHIHRSKDGVVHYDGDPVMMGKDLYIKIVRKGLLLLTPAQHTDIAPTALNVLRTLHETFVGELTQRNRAFLRKLTKGKNA
jgi:YegS/Rv2252/BmrU family lipid kinase